MTTFERIKNISKKKGYSSLRVLSETAGLGPNAIYQWRDKTPRTDNLQAVADVLGVSVDYLLGNTDEMHANKKNPEKMDSIELSEALRKEGASLQFEGKEISDEYKKILLGILQNLK